MRTQIILTLLSLFGLAGCSQTPAKPIHLNEIGWTLTLPEGYNIMDSSGINSSMERGKKIFDSVQIQKVDLSERKILLAAKKGTNFFMASVTPFDEKTDGNWKNSDQQVHEIIFQGLANKLPAVQFDSVTLLETIDSLVFNKFFMIGQENGSVVYHSVMLSKLYKGYNFGINYVYDDETSKKEIEGMLKQSRFAK